MAIIWERIEHELKARKRNRFKKRISYEAEALKKRQELMRHLTLVKLKEAQKPFKDKETKQTELTTKN